MKNDKEKTIEPGACRPKPEILRQKFSLQMYRLLPKKDLEKIEEMALFFLKKNDKG
jgi:hypothetical protein